MCVCYWVIHYVNLVRGGVIVEMRHLNFPRPGSRISQKGTPTPRVGANLLFSQTSMQTAWKWRKLIREGRARPKFVSVDPSLDGILSRKGFLMSGTCVHSTHFNQRNFKMKNANLEKFSFYKQGRPGFIIISSLLTLIFSPLDVTFTPNERVVKVLVQVMLLLAWWYTHLFIAMSLHCTKGMPI